MTIAVGQYNVCSKNFDFENKNIFSTVCQYLDFMTLHRISSCNRLLNQLVDRFIEKKRFEKEIQSIWKKRDLYSLLALEIPGNLREDLSVQSVLLKCVVNLVSQYAVNIEENSQGVYLSLNGCDFSSIENEKILKFITVHFMIKTIKSGYICRPDLPFKSFKMTLDGVNLLCSAIKEKRITDLVVASLFLTDEVAVAFAEQLPLCGITSSIILEGAFSEEGVDTLSEALARDGKKEKSILIKGLNNKFKQLCGWNLY